jgi:hypothetical protein
MRARMNSRGIVSFPINDGRVEDHMSKKYLVISLALVLICLSGAGIAQGQPPGRGQGYGMMGGHGMYHGMGPGVMDGGWIDVPQKLPAPSNAEWIGNLKDVLIQEKEALAQYEADQEKFNAFMPYMMLIPQEENHVRWIEQLFKAYGLPAGEKKPSPVVDNKTLADAYAYSVKMENALLPRYEWLVKNAGDSDSAYVLNAILLQSRWHLVIFDHALRMGHGHGFNKGWGMWSGNMPGGLMSRSYDFGAGRSFGWQYPAKPIDTKEAEAMMKDYLQSSRNPNLKLGKIKDAGKRYEAEILSRNNDLVDRVFIDKRTGRIWSAY